MGGENQQHDAWMDESTARVRPPAIWYYHYSSQEQTHTLESPMRQRIKHVNPTTTTVSTHTLSIQMGSSAAKTADFTSVDMLAVRW